MYAGENVGGNLANIFAPTRHPDDSNLYFRVHGYSVLSHRADERSAVRTESGTVSSQSSSLLENSASWAAAH